MKLKVNVTEKQIALGMRLRPSPESLRRKQEIIKEMGKLFLEERAIADSSERFAGLVHKLNSECIPEYRCDNCGTLLRAHNKHCPSCHAEGQDFR